MSSSKRKGGALFMAAASVCWSLGGVCVKFIPWDAMTISAIRSFLAAIVFILYYKNIKIKFTPGNILAALCLSGTIILFVFANKLTTAAAAILLQFTAPIFIILIQFVFYKIRPALSSLAAVFITMLGMLLFFADDLDGTNALGNVLAIASGLCFAGVFVCNKRKDTHTEQSLLLGFLINAVIGMPFAIRGVTADVKAWLAIIVLGVVQVGIAYIFFSVGIKKTPALFACLITATEPVLNPVLVVLFMGEVPGPFAICGGAIIFITVICYNIHEEKQRKLKI